MKAHETTTGTDRIIAVIISLVILCCGLLNLDNNCDWGDDFAAYMADGIAIARGDYRSQIHINSFLRDGDSSTDASHIHSFGMPLTHSLVYLLCGFDRVNFDNLCCYKLPSLLFFSLFAGIFYVFLRKRFSLSLSILSVFLLCGSEMFFHSIRNLGNDIIYMSVSFICFAELESFAENEKGRAFHALILGLCLWFSYSVRLNGIAVLIAGLLYFAIEYFGKKKKATFALIVPYAVFTVLFLSVNCFLFPKPTSTSSFSSITPATFADGIKYYSFQCRTFIASIAESALIEPMRFVQKLLMPEKDPITAYRYIKAAVTAMFFAVSALGLAVNGFRENLHISMYTVFSFLITAAFNLGQDLRYLYTVLPFLFMFFAYGLSFLSGLRKKGREKREKTGAFGAVICVGLSLLCMMPMIKADAENIRTPSREDLTAYSDSAVDIYNYIENNTDKDSIIAFFKPRALFLNTERLSFIPERNGVPLSEADYYLYYKYDPDFLIPDDSSDNYRLIYENEDFALYSET